METTWIQDLAENLSQPPRREHPLRSEPTPQTEEPGVSLWEGFIPDPVEPRELGLDDAAVAGDSSAGGSPAGAPPAGVSPRRAQR
jgi:hypothetical protein